MEIKLYNSLSHSLETLKPIRKGRVGVYSCGPTVYSTPTIGNFRSFLAWDVLVRALEACGYEVMYVMNITDVGHLVSDGDEGDDKLEVGAKREGKTAWDVADRYTKVFLSDMERLNFRMPNVMPKATDHIKEQIAMVQVLEAKGFAYKISDGVYFDTSKVKNYGALAGQEISEKEEGARVGVNVEKRNASDFALWKFSPEGKKRDMEWDSPWGVGFPGWHIECTAMSTKYLGLLYDIHTGGMDLKMVHHPNEIAQSEGANETGEANMWLHAEFLQVDGGKMSKSLGNTYSISDLVEKGYDPLVFRYLCMTAHYRSHLNFTFISLESSAAALNKLRRAVGSWGPASGFSEKYEERFMGAMRDDLNTPEALAILWEMVKDDSISKAEKAGTVVVFDKVLGLNLAQSEENLTSLPSNVQKLAEERTVARQNKNYTLSDSLRIQIMSLGYAVEDTDDGMRITKVQ